MRHQVACETFVKPLLFAMHLRDTDTKIHTVVEVSMCEKSVRTSHNKLGSIVCFFCRFMHNLVFQWKRKNFPTVPPSPPSSAALQIARIPERETGLPWELEAHCVVTRHSLLLLLLLCLERSLTLSLPLLPLQRHCCNHVPCHTFRPAAQPHRCWPMPQSCKVNRIQAMCSPRWACTVQRHQSSSRRIVGLPRRIYWHQDQRKMILSCLWHSMTSRRVERINWVSRRANRCAYSVTTSPGSGARRTPTLAMWVGCPRIMWRLWTRWRSTPGITDPFHAMLPSICSARGSMAVFWCVRAKVHRVKGASVWGELEGEIPFRYTN